MTKKDRTVIGLVVITLTILLAVIIKNGSNQLSMPHKAGKLSAPLSFEKPAAESPPPRRAYESSASEAPNLAPTSAAVTRDQSPAEGRSVEETTKPENDIEQPLTATELALKFHSALNGLEDASETGNTEDSAFLLVSLFAELPDDPQAEAELARELATAYVQSSDADEKAALVDLLMIIPSDAALELGETLSRSNNPEERQMGLDLIANGRSAENFGE